MLGSLKGARNYEGMKRKHNLEVYQEVQQSHGHIELPPLESWSKLSQSRANLHFELLTGLFLEGGEDETNLLTQIDAPKQLKGNREPNEVFEVGQILDVNPPILTVIARAIQLKRDKSKLEICNRHVLKSRELNPQSTQIGAFGIRLSTRSETVRASVLKKAITVKGIYERGSLQSNSALTISLLYNECSFVAISRWAASGKSFKPLYNGSSIQIPTASAKFRICCLCRKVGHYDVECSSVDESCLAQVIAPEIRAQTSLSVSSGEERHNEAKPNNSDLGTKIVLATRELPFGLGQPPSRTLGDILKRRPSNEVTSPRVSFAQRRRVSSDNDQFAKSVACQVCDTSLREDDVLLCDGCDAPYHFQCLDPPLEGVPSGSWFCRACALYDSDVSSVIDVEPCGEYLIEQRRASLAPKTISQKAMGFDEDCGTTAVSVLKPDSCQDLSLGTPQQYGVDDSSTVKSDNNDQWRPVDWLDAEIEEQDDILLLSRPIGRHKKDLSVQNDVWDPLQESDRGNLTFSAISTQSLDGYHFVGSIVAWYVINRVNKYTDEADLPATMVVGGVVTIDKTKAYALVRIFKDLSHSLSILKESFTEKMKNNRNISICETAIGSIELGSCSWVPTKDLLVVSKSAGALAREKVVSGLESALKSEVRKRKHGAAPYVSECPSTPAKINPHDAGSAVFQAERILDEKFTRVRGETIKQYLIKWKGFSFSESTWEPEEHILSQNLVRIFHVEQLINQLSETPEAHDCSSVTARVIDYLEEGKNRLRLAETAGNRGSKPVGRVCPFCQNWFRGAQGLFKHLQIHQKEPNSNMVIKACKLGFDQVYDSNTSIPPPFR